MNDSDVESDSEAPGSDSSHLRFISQSILAQLAHLDLSSRLSKRRKVISGGAYGDISKARCFTCRGPVKVAIKCLRFYLKDDIKSESDSSLCVSPLLMDTNYQLFEKEVYVWSKLKQENILPLMGYAIDAMTGFPLLVSEWMENGSAWTYVNSHQDPDVLRLVIGIATGLAYLHQNGVVHSDIKSDNVLVSASGDALICDFGCSRIIAASRSLANVSSGIRGTSRYLAYELVAPIPSCHTQKTDVWAFGMTVYELAFRQRPYADLTEFQVISAIMRYELPQLPTIDTFDHDFKKKLIFRIICIGCWTRDPAERPDMIVALTKLREEQQSLALEWSTWQRLTTTAFLPSFSYNSHCYPTELTDPSRSGVELPKLVSPASPEGDLGAVNSSVQSDLPRSVASSGLSIPVLGLVPGTSSNQKPRRTRRYNSKSGCYTCRIRRKKCDEKITADGSCSTCERLRLQCLGFGVKCPDWMREEGSVQEAREKIKVFLAANGMIKSTSMLASNEEVNLFIVSSSSQMPVF
ncbi:hypothetical protein ACEPAH_7366 [Sanghuangporus vaninii]